MKLFSFMTILAFAASASASSDYGLPVSGRPGFVKSPYAPDKGEIDVRGFPKDSEVKDPFLGKMFLVPESNQPGATQPASLKAAEEYHFEKLNFEELSVREAIDLIGTKAKIKVHHAAAKDELQKVTFDLTHVDALSAFGYAAKAAQLKVDYKEDGVYFTR